MSNQQKKLIPILVGVVGVLAVVCIVKQMSKDDYSPQSNKMFNPSSNHHPLYSNVKFQEQGSGCQEPEQVTYKLPIGGNQLIGMVYPPRRS